mmetsp:Transcript_50168/g.98175  ORF Transcript_50168/g.98175 Transcript_50168/m.98175 type:complete len:890 (-) Transcript_50168:567-3236(-)
MPSLVRPKHGQSIAKTNMRVVSRTRPLSSSERTSQHPIMPSPVRPEHGQNIAGTNVRVVTRVRPLSSSEKARGCSHIIETIPAGETEFLEIGAEKRRFELDAAFPSESTQVDVYERSGAAEAVKLDLIKGFNTTILAYGQTGSGKTFTMGTAISPEGNANGNDLHESEGVIPRAVNDLFHISKTTPNSVKVEMAYMEIYNEEIRDLLSNDPNSGDLRVQDLPDGTVGVTNVTMKSVESPAEVGKWMEVASNKRVVASTAMNAVSSRSHAVCTLYVTITPGIVISNGEDDYASDDDVSEIKSIASENKSTVSNGTFSSREQIFAKLTLVDLAGSEKPKRTGATGARMKEGININKGLFVLGQVISTLSDNCSKSERKHIPYRESKLTRLLQDSLGGNTRTIMINCVSPAEENIEESTNSLRYAERARSIRNNVKRNVFSTALSPAAVAKLQEENKKLKLQLELGLTDKDRIKRLEKDLLVSNDRFSSVSKQAENWRNKFGNVCNFIKNAGLDLPEGVIDEALRMIAEQDSTEDSVEGPNFEKNESRDEFVKLATIDESSDFLNEEPEEIIDEAKTNSIKNQKININCSADHNPTVIVEEQRKNDEKETNRNESVKGIDIEEFSNLLNDNSVKPPPLTLHSTTLLTDESAKLNGEPADLMYDVEVPTNELLLQEGVADLTSKPVESIEISDVETFDVVPATELHVQDLPDGTMGVSKSTSKADLPKDELLLQEVNNLTSRPMESIEVYEDSYEVVWSEPKLLLCDLPDGTVRVSTPEKNHWMEIASKQNGGVNFARNAYSIIDKPPRLSIDRRRNKIRGIFGLFKKKHSKEPSSETTSEGSLNEQSWDEPEKGRLGAAPVGNSDWESRSLYVKARNWKSRPTYGKVQSFVP